MSRGNVQQSLEQCETNRPSDARCKPRQQLQRRTALNYVMMG